METRTLDNHDKTLKALFEELYPDYAARMAAASARSPEAALEAYQLIYAECTEKAAPYLCLAKKDERVVSGPFIIDADQYSGLIHAENDDIKYKIQTIMNTMEYLKSLEGQSNTIIAANLAAVGVCALEMTSYFVVKPILAAGAYTFDAALAAVTGCRTAIMAVVSLVVVAIIIPLIYFMTKPANCIILLINETDEEVTFEDDYNVHGKPVTFVQELPGIIMSQAGPAGYSIGFITTQKRDAALYGTQYGFRMKSKAGKMYVFGSECPLTSLYSGNNCYCSFTGSAEDAAKQTTEDDRQDYTASDGSFKLSIKCHSKSGSIAYYVARIYKE